MTEIPVKYGEYCYCSLFPKEICRFVGWVYNYNPKNGDHKTDEVWIHIRVSGLKKVPVTTIFV